jgi:serine protease Do
VQPGDIILSYDGKPIERSNELAPLVAGAAGKSVALEVWRDKSNKSITVAAAEGGGQEKVARNEAKAAKGRLGVAVRPIAPEERRDGGPKDGVVIAEASGAAARAGLQAGDVIVSFNGAAVKSPEDLRERVAKAGKTAAVLIDRDGRRIFVPVELG